MKKQNVYTVKEATAKLMRYCVYRERCHKEVEQKLWQFHLTAAERQKVISNLIADDFLNEERFVLAFVHDKFHLQHWGKIRITQELKFRKISSYLIRKGLKQIKDEEYHKTFQLLFQKRKKAVNEKNKWKRKRKIADYLLRKGYESELIYEALRNLD